MVACVYYVVTLVHSSIGSDLVGVKVFHLSYLVSLPQIPKQHTFYFVSKHVNTSFQIPHSHFCLH